jgi:hypothetical protein
MQQTSGFENRFIDTYLYFNGVASENGAEIPYYAPVFKANNPLLVVDFPGTKVAHLSAVHTEGNVLPSAGVILPAALIVALILFVFLKNVLKSSIWSLFLIGFSPKSMQQTERRQIERNILIINSINAVSCFSFALILYALAIRFDFSLSLFEQLGISEMFFYPMLFLLINCFVFGFFFARNRLLTFFGSVFSVSTMMKEYKKPYKLLFVSMLPVLFFIALFIAFAPYSLMSYIAPFLFAIIAAIYSGFIVISILNFSNFINRFSIHFFLYLCTLEILPFFAMVKLMKGVYF